MAIEDRQTSNTLQSDAYNNNHVPNISYYYYYASDCGDSNNQFDYGYQGE